MSMTSVASITSEKKQLTFIDIAEKAKFYTSLCLGTTAFLSVFAFLFLIPFIVDPAISSLMADYEAEPVTCIVTQHVYAEGISNCSWASCREGCTREVTRCHQIYVNYSKTPFREYRPHKISEWDVVDTHFLINTEGCGYPPSVNCSEFSQQYGYSTAGTPFPCYYSRTYPDIQVVARYSWEDTLRHLVLSITIPNLLFAASIGILTYWYCPGCKRSCQKYIHHFPTDVDTKTMGRRNKCKPRMIPQQDKKICGCICFCQLLVVFSCVSLIYLTVAVYIPSYRTFHSGYEERPVMCQTINTSTENNCSWASCGEWCLTKTSGFCPQIHALTRQNGTKVQFLNCTNFQTSFCPPVSVSELKRHNCNNGTECASLKGLFNCSLGHCTNMSKIYQCHYKADGFTVDSDRDNVKLNGFFECRGAKCTKIKKAFRCDRICKENITSTAKNVYVSVGNKVHTATCNSAEAFNKANGKEEGVDTDPVQFWTKLPGEVLMVSCHTLNHNEVNQTISAMDCINGTIFDSSIIPKPYSTFRQFWNLTGQHRNMVDPTNKYVPLQSSLTIYNASRLYINLEGCVNTLKGECLEFLHSHGRDGRNQTASSRYPCFYNKKNSFMVLARYDLQRTWRDMIIAISVPSALFVVSFVTLCAIMQSVRVDDDTKMRCKYCFSSYSSDLTEMINSKYEAFPDNEPSANKTNEASS
nr:unnamed protein product [Callosobruchus chinensis]